MDERSKAFYLLIPNVILPLLVNTLKTTYAHYTNIP